jgi:hypothetical protein
MRWTERQNRIIEQKKRKNIQQLMKHFNKKHVTRRCLLKDAVAEDIPKQNNKYSTNHNESPPPCKPSSLSRGTRPMAMTT